MVKEASRDEIACENTVLHNAGAVQLGSGLLLLDRTDQTIAAANETLLFTYQRLMHLQDICQSADAKAIGQEIRAGITCRLLRHQNDRSGRFVIENKNTRCAAKWPQCTLRPFCCGYSKAR